MIQVELWNEVAQLDVYECSTMEEVREHIRKEFLPVLDTGDIIKIIGDE